MLDVQFIPNYIHLGKDYMNLIRKRAINMDILKLIKYVESLSKPTKTIKKSRKKTPISGKTNTKRLGPKNIPASVRNKVWVEYMGRIHVGLCYCCRVEPITKANFDCGHIQSRAEGGALTIQNLRPVCGLCNKSMGTMNMISFMEMYGYDTKHIKKTIKKN